MLESLLIIILSPFALCAIAAIFITIVCLILMAVAAVKSRKITSTIYCGTEENVEFFKSIMDALGLNIKYQVEIVDGEYEINILE